MFKPKPKVKDLGGLEEQMLATIYGNCVGDAIGLLSEFMSKDTANKVTVRRDADDGLL